MTTTSEQEDTTMAAPAETTTTEEWIYAGRRLNRADKTMHLWIDPDGEERWFAKLPATNPGATYTVEVEHVADGGVRAGTPRYLAPDQASRHATDAQRERFRAEDRAAMQILEGIRAEKAAADDDELQAALEVLRRYRARLRAYGKRAAFTTYVAGELERPPKPTDDD